MTEARGPFRVLMLNYEFPPIGGGTGVACKHLLRAFGGLEEVRVDLVTSGVGSSAVLERPAENISIHRLPVGKRELDFWRASELARWMVRAHRTGRRMARGERYDLCHCWAGWPPGLLGYLLRDEVPYLVSLRGSDVPGYNPRLRLLDPMILSPVSRRVWGSARALVAVSERLRRLALRTSPASRIRVIPNGTDLEHFTPDDPIEDSPAGTSDESMTVLFVGRLIPRKRADALIEAFAVVRRELEGARLVIVGDGPEGGSLRARTRELGLEETVMFRGRVPYEALPPIYRSADVFALPSLREGMPNVVLEAMASGLPVVTTDAGAELVDGNGLAVGAGRPEELAKALIRYGRDPSLRAAHGVRSREIAEASSWESVARWYLDLYSRMLADGGVS